MWRLGVGVFFFFLSGREPSELCELTMCWIGHCERINVLPVVTKKGWGGLVRAFSSAMVPVSLWSARLFRYTI